MKINTSRKSGFTLVEIMIVVAIIGLLAAIAIPNFVRARKTAQMNACVNNLRLIDSAVQQYLLENGNVATVTAIGTVVPYLGRGTTGQEPSCPAGGAYTVNSANDGSAATCSLSNDADFPHTMEPAAAAVVP